MWKILLILMLEAGGPVLLVLMLKAGDPVLLVLMLKAGGPVLLVLMLEASGPVLGHLTVTKRPFGQPWPGLSNCEAHPSIKVKVNEI